MSGYRRPSLGRRLLRALVRVLRIVVLSLSAVGPAPPPPPLPEPARIEQRQAGPVRTVRRRCKNGLRKGLRNPPRWATQLGPRGSAAARAALRAGLLGRAHRLEGRIEHEHVVARFELKSPRRIGGEQLGVRRRVE